jgi:Na+-driven multidrug efflux pump
MFAKFKKLFKPIDLTTGNVFKKLILFLIPIMLSSACLQLFNLTDSVVAGHFLSPEEIAGINDVGALSNFSLMFAIGCSSGFAVVISHRFGKKQTGR